MALKRFVIHVGDSQLKLLNDEADRVGVTRGEIVRRAIDHYLPRRIREIFESERIDP